jgi:hypothetical protein
MNKENEDKTITDLTIVSPSDYSDSPTLIEITTYIREDQAFALEILENAERYRLGRDFDRAILIQEALDLLIERSIAAADLRKNRIVKRGD